MSSLTALSKKCFYHLYFLYIQYSVEDGTFALPTYLPTPSVEDPDDEDATGQGDTDMSTIQGGDSVTLLLLR